jgi:DNA-binding transcriptional regulator YhcF (GntR family)
MLPGERGPVVDFHLDRKLSIPLSEQIRGQIKYAIAYGQLNAGDPLPSVRDLAQQLKVAPMTISRVYNELAAESLVFTRPRSGTFVAEMARVNVSNNPSTQNLRQIISTAIRQARLMGHTHQEIKDTFEALISELEEPLLSPNVILVGNFQRTTENYARAVEEILHDLDIRVLPVIIKDLKSDFSSYQDVIQKARLTITVATRFNEVRALLEPKYSRVVAVAFSISKEIRKTLAELPTETRLGVLTTYPEFLQTMLEGVHSFAILKDPPLCAILGQTEQIKEMFSQIDVLLYASGSEAVLEYLPADVSAIEFLHTPVPESLNRLRSYLS